MMGTPRAHKQIQALIVERRDQSRATISNALLRRGYAVLAVQDRCEAFRILDGGSEPDVMLLDDPAGEHGPYRLISFLDGATVTVDFVGEPVENAPRTLDDLLAALDDLVVADRRQHPQGDFSPPY